MSVENSQSENAAGGGVGVEGDVLVVGLGNPGEDYAHSRHNLGVRVVRELGARLGVPVDRKRWRSLVGSGQLPGAGARRVWLMLPQTYMNLSGRAVGAAVRDTSVLPGQVWIVHDELDLPLCRLRIRLGGSAAGHNGLRSIIGALGTEDFVRFRIGVGKPPSAAAGARFVLGRFSSREEPLVGPLVEGVTDAVELALRSGLEAAMGEYNRAGALGCEGAG